MRKVCLSLLTCMLPLSAFAAGDEARITSNPSPAVSNKALEISISTTDFNSTVFLYSWCENSGGTTSISPFTWDGVNTDKFRMTGSGGNYTFKIEDIKSFYSLTDSQLEELTKLGFIAKTSNGAQTKDLFVEVVQGRKTAYSGGEGTQAAPFIISKDSDLIDLASTPSDWDEGIYFRMEEDIDAITLTNNIGNASTPFKGNFDGNGYSIRNLNLTNTKVSSTTGLFGVIDGADIHDLGLIDASISGSTYTGVLVGLMNNGTVARCFSTGVLTSNSICTGGLVGENKNGIITDCYSATLVGNESDYATGGLVGKNTGIIKNTYATGSVGGFDYVGGIVGANYGKIINSVALNEMITCPNDYAARFGGNNNSRNISESNYSWTDIAKGHEEWSEFGDYASNKTASDLHNEIKFRNLTGWDFNSVWEWRSEGSKNYPALRGLKNQHCTLPDNFYRLSVGTEMAIMPDNIQVGPNPVETILWINAPAAVSAFSLYGINGGLIMEGTSVDSTDFPIDMTSRPGGMYILRLEFINGTISTHKIIKK